MSGTQSTHDYNDHKTLRACAGQALKVPMIIMIIRHLGPVRVRHSKYP